MADSLSIQDRRSEDGDRRERRPLSLMGNGKANWLKQALVGASLAALVSFAVAAWTASGQAQEQSVRTAEQIQTGLAVIIERQKNQNEALLQAIQELREDIREQRGRR